MIKWIYSNFFVMQNIEVFIIYIVSIIIIILATIFLVNLELRKAKNDN